MLKVPIRNYGLPGDPRVFDVTVDDAGNVIRYDMQNIKGRMFIEEDEVIRQVREAMKDKKAV